MDDELVGGLYGVALGRMFFGESMFTRRTDGSKIAIAHLAAQLRALAVSADRLPDAHLASGVARRRGHVAAAVRARVERLVREPGRPGAWTLDEDLSGSFV